MSGPQPDQVKPMLSRLARLWFDAARLRDRSPRHPRADALERRAVDLERRIDRAIERQERVR